MRQRIRIGMVALGLILFIMGWDVAYGQGIVGEIFGTVTDPVGAVVPGAEVAVRNTATNEERRVTTSDAGTYLITSLPPGTYSVQVTKSGFKVGVVNDVQLLVKQSREVDVALQLGEGTVRDRKGNGNCSRGCSRHAESFSGAGTHFICSEYIAIEWRELCCTHSPIAGCCPNYRSSGRSLRPARPDRWPA